MYPYHSHKHTMFVVTKSDSLNYFLTSQPYDKLADSAAKTALNNFEWSYTTLLIFNSTMVTGVDLFLKLYNQTQIIGRGLFYPPYAQITRQCIMFGVDLSSIDRMLHWMNYHQFDNTGKYIIICESTDCDENEVANLFWVYKITNVVFMKLGADGQIEGYTYLYPDANCVISKPVRAEICSNDNTSCNSLFPKKLLNFHSCPITVSTFIQIPYMNITNGKPKGSDGDLLALIAEQLNASLNVMTPRIGDGWGRLEINGTWTGSLADVLDDVADISMTSAALTISRFSYFQMSIAYYTSNVVWISRTAKEKPASLKLFYPFETNSQIVLAISFIFVGLCAWFVNSPYWPLQNKTGTSNSNENVLFFSWMICMGLPSTKLPIKPAFLYMTLIWIWYCFLIRTFYQVCLISSLQGVFYYDQLDTIDEAYENNYSFGGGLSLREYYIEYPWIYDNWKNLKTPEIVPTLMNLSEHSINFVLAMNSETAKHVIKEKKLSVRILPQPIITSPTVIFFKKFSPLVHTVNRILLHLSESGFIQNIHKHYDSIPESKQDNRTPITLEHYTGCYLILLIGWIVSFIIFIIEFCYGKLRKRK